MQVVILFSAFNCFAGSVLYTDVPVYNQDWFNGNCSGDCSPTAAGMVLAWYDSHGWPRMVHGGSNDFEKNPLGVMDLVHDLSQTSGYECNYGTIVELYLANAIEESANNMDPGANFDTNTAELVRYSHITGCIDDHGPLIFDSVAGLEYYYGSSSSAILGGKHTMTMIGYDDGGTYYGVTSRWIMLNMGWGDYRTPAWVDFDNHGSSDIYSIRVYSGGTPSPDDDDSYEDNDKFEDAKSITTGNYSILECNDEDWFKIYSNTGTLDITINFSHSNGDLNLELYNSSNSRIEYSNGTSDTEEISYSVNSTGYYFVKVFGYDGAINNYSLSINYTPVSNPPLKAANPSPINGAAAQSINTDISWTNGGGAVSYDVYFGTDSTPDSDEFKGNQTATTYDPGTLNYDATYYWRIDARNSDGTTTGDVWHFRTLSGDNDSDGLTNDDEINIYGTDPNKADTDNDGIQDGTELGITMDDIGPDTDTDVFQPDFDPTTTTDPLDNDTDDDFILDGMEDANHNGVVDSGETDPHKADTDSDGHNDGEEVNAGSNPLNKLSFPAETAISLKKGFNLVAIPAEVVYQPDLKDWLPVIGDNTEIEKLLVYDYQAGNLITLIPGDVSNQSFVLQGGDGLIVYAKQDKEITFTTVLCSALDLKPGFNIVGFACPVEGYSAYQLLNDLSSENITSIQRYSTEKGAFETAGFDPDGDLAGVDFSILAGEGYFIYIK